MKRFKKLGVALLSATLLLIPCMTSINAQDNPYDTWKTTALKSPSKGQLVAAGDIKISWSPLEKVQHYDIYFDGKYEKSVEANITQTTIYSTAVARHTIRVVAVLENNDEINVSERTFYISKKGIGLYEDDQGINSLSYVQNMGVSWYYNWGEEAYDNQDEVNSELEFVPMIWNDAGNVSERLKSLKEKGYDIESIYQDCGLLIFDGETQDTHSGGSGCGCSASVLAAYILPELAKGTWKKVLFVPTGALLSKTSFNEGDSIPGIAHAVVLEHVSKKDQKQ